MGKQWAKQQVKRNEVQEFMEKAVAWIAANREKVLIGTGAAAAAVVLASFAVYRHEVRKTDAWDRLTVAQAYAFSGRADESLKQVGEISRDYSSSDASGYAALFEGDVLYRKGTYKEAAAAYGRLVEKGTPKGLQPFALSSLAMAQEAGGQAQEAAATCRRFLDAHPDHFLAPHVHATLARSLNAAKDLKELQAVYQKITLQYPETPWASWAQAKLQGK